MVYAMHPEGEVQPVQVSPDDTIASLVDALDALDLFGDDALDPDWLSGEGASALADAARLRVAAERYAALVRSSDVGAALRAGQCPYGALDALEQFFGFVAETAGHDLVIEHLR